MFSNSQLLIEQQQPDKTEPEKEHDDWVESVLGEGTIPVAQLSATNQVTQPSTPFSLNLFPPPSSLRTLTPKEAKELAAQLKQEKQFATYLEKKKEKKAEAPPKTKRPRGRPRDPGGFFKNRQKREYPIQAEELSQAKRKKTSVY